MNAILGYKIRRIREVKGFTQDFIASKIGISQNAYCKIEKGETKVDSDRLNAIATALEVDKETILNYNDNIIINNTNSTNSGMFNNYYASQIEMFEKLLNEKDKIISLKDEIIIFLKDEIIELKNVSLSSKKS